MSVSNSVSLLNLNNYSLCVLTYYVSLLQPEYYSLLLSGWPKLLKMLYHYFYRRITHNPNPGGQLIPCYTTPRFTKARSPVEKMHKTDLCKIIEFQVLS